MRTLIGCLAALGAGWLLLTAMPAPEAAPAGPYFATGIKICEVDSSSAIVWTRLTRNPVRAGKDRPLPVVRYKDPASGAFLDNRRGRPDLIPVVEFPGGSGIDTIEGAVPGAPGEVMVRYKAAGATAWQTAPWKAVDPQRDFTAHFPLKGLRPATAYELEVESRSGRKVNGGFRTAPVPSAPARVVFTVVTGTAYPDQDAPGGGYKIYAQMRKLDPSFFVHTGDIVYYDQLGKTAALARWHWHSMYSLPTNLEFHRQVPSYFIKDDHDTWMNDCWPTMKTRFMGEFTFQQGQAIFLEQVGMGPSTIRTFRWGKDLQVWLPEGRDFRSPNDMPDGPEKSIWGKKQKEWFKRTVQASDATFRILISPTPLVGPDRANKGDNHANKQFTHEGNELRAFIASQKNMYVVTGDRHWQYVSVDAKSGVREFSCGPASDEHAGGYTMDQRRPEHRYLNIVGGFLAGTVERQGGAAVLTFRHHGVDGKVLNEDRLPAR